MGRAAAAGLRCAASTTPRHRVYVMARRLRASRRYKGKCEEVISCTQAGDLDCLKKRAVPLCNLQLQQEGGTAPWKKALVSTPAPRADRPRGN